jgi:hypothetical protein
LIEFLLAIFEKGVPRIVGAENGATSSEKICDIGKVQNFITQRPFEDSLQAVVDSNHFYAMQTCVFHNSSYGSIETWTISASSQ